MAGSDAVNHVQKKLLVQHFGFFPDFLIRMIYSGSSSNPRKCVHDSIDI